MFSGKNVVVSGAAGGVGRQLVEKLVQQGASVCATDISDDVHLLAEMSPKNVVVISADVSKSADVDNIFRIATEKFGKTDILLSNAGFIIPKSVHETTEDEWDQVLNANAKSLFLMSKYVLPAMMANGNGVIVATGSISSVLGLPRQAAYCAAKGALLQLVRQMAIDYAEYGIRVNAVGAGSINTPFLTKYLEGLQDAAAERDAIRAAHPLGRWAQASEIADAILYLAGPKSSFVTGQILMADGGYSAR